MKRRVLLIQVNNLFGRSAFLPYSVGCLQAYAQAQPDLEAAYRFLPLVFLREHPQTLIAATPTPDVIGFSNYIWNAEYNLATAAEMRAAWPEALIVFGGPQVPERDADDFLRRHPFIDLLVHHEGELAFAEILRERLKDTPKYGRIPGLTFQGRLDSVPRPADAVLSGGPARRIADLSELPSPYLTGVFSGFPWIDYDLHASQETHRGCPFECRFCDWGGMIFAKVGAFPSDRVLAEYDWFADQRIDLLYNCIAEGQLITTPCGLTPVESLKMGDEVTGWDPISGQIRVNKVGGRIYRGGRDTWEVGHELGSVIATADHRFWTRHGWKRLRELTVGDEVLSDLWSATHRIAEDLSQDLRLQGMSPRSSTRSGKSSEERRDTKQAVCDSEGNIRRSDREENCQRRREIVRWSRVRRILRVGLRRVYDVIEARPSHSFFANGILVANCDANFAMLPRDDKLVDALIETKARTGYPRQIRAAWAKNANQRVFDLASKLHAAGMSKGVTLSLQSTDPHTLEVIKRKNIAMEDFEGWVKRYETAGIGTYTELILGLPGETYDTFADGIDRVLRAGQHHGLHIYLCAALPNSELSDPAYARGHGIRTIRGPLLQQHATPDPTATEIADIVVGTKTMPEEDWLRAALFAWAVQAFHCLGLTTEAAKAAVALGDSYRQFYENLIAWARDALLSSLGMELWRAQHRLRSGMQGGPWGEVVPGFGDVIWPVEEATFLHVIGNLGTFYDDLGRWLRRHPTFREALRRDQEALVLPTEEPFCGDRERYAREILWFGRKAMKHRRQTEAA